MATKRVPTFREAMRKKEKLGVRLLKQGKSAKEIAEDKRIQVHPTTVQRWARKHEIVLTYPHNRHKGRNDLVDVGEIVRLRKLGGNVGGKWRRLFTLVEIAGLCDCSLSYVKQILAKARENGDL